MLISEEEVPVAALRLIDLIYEAILAPDTWPRFLAELSDITYAKSSFMIVSGPDMLDAQVTLGHNLAPELMRIHAEKYGDNDPWVRPETARTGLIGLTQEGLTDEELRQHPMFEDVLRPGDLFYGGALVALVSPVGFSAVSVFRPFSRGPYDDRLRQLFRLLFPHLNRAARMLAHISRLRGENQSLRTGVNQLPVGFLLFDEQGSVVHLNDSAGAMIEKADGLALVGNQLGALSGADNIRLKAAIQSAVRGGSTGIEKTSATVLVSRPEGKLPYCVTLSSLATASPQPFMRRSASASALIKDLAERPQPRRDVLADYFTFTNTECNVAERLAAGDSLEQIAAKFHVSLHTVRTHVKRMLSKSGTARQAELVSVLNGIGHI